MSDPARGRSRISMTREDLSALFTAWRKTGKCYRGAHCVRYVGMRNAIARAAGTVLWIPRCDLDCGKNLRLGRPQSRYILSRSLRVQGSLCAPSARERRNEKEIQAEAG